MFILPDFPENSSSWLSPAEQALAILRMREDSKHAGSEEIGEFAGMILALKDWKVWWLALTCAGLQLSVSFNIYFPTLTATLGFNRTISLLLCAPPSIIVAIIAFFLARSVPNEGFRML